MIAITPQFWARGNSAGANTVNAALLIGDRFRGSSGAGSFLLALLAMPLVLIAVIVPTIVSRLFQTFRRLCWGSPQPPPGSSSARRSSSPTGIQPIFPGISACLATFIAVGLLRCPLVPVVLVAAPCSIAAALWMRRQ